ncbi:MAG: oligosaccharide flippase family protein [Endomicrobiia bacterium]
MSKIYRKIFWDTTKYIILRNFFMGVTGIINIFFVRFLGPYEYGKYSLVWNLISTLGPILSLGWLNTLTKFVPQKVSLQEKYNLLSQSLISIFFAGSLFLLTMIFIKKFFQAFLPAEIKDIFYIFIIFVVLVSFFNAFEGFWRGLGKFNEFVIIDGIRSNTSSILGLILIIYGFLSYKTILKSNFFVSLIFLVILFSISFKNFNFKILNFEKQIIIFCLTFLFGQFIYMLSINLDVLLLRGILKDPAQVGFYFASTRVPKLIETMLISQIPAPFFYYFSSNQNFAMKNKILIFSSKFLGFIFGIVGLIFFSFAEYILPFLFGKNYLESVEAFRFFSLYLPVFGFVVLFSPFFVSENKPFIFISVYGLVMILLYNFLNIVFIYRFKFFALIISYLTAFVVFVFIICFVCLIKFNINLIYNFLYLVSFIFISCVVEILFKIKIAPFLFLTLCFSIKFIKIDEIKKFLNFLINKDIKLNI